MPKYKHVLRHSDYDSWAEVNHWIERPETTWAKGRRDANDFGVSFETLPLERNNIEYTASSLDQIIQSVFSSWDQSLFVLYNRHKWIDYRRSWQTHYNNGPTYFIRNHYTLRIHDIALIFNDESE